MKKPKNFKNREAYRKWLAYGHMRGMFERTPGHQVIEIRGEKKRVQHNKK